MDGHSGRHAEALKTFPILHAVDFFTHVVLSPGQTYNRLLNNGFGWEHKTVALLVGLLTAWISAIERGDGKTMALPLNIGLGIVSGICIGIFMIYTYGWLMTYSGRWLGGVGTTSQLRAAWSAGELPMTYGLLVLLAMVTLPETIPYQQWINLALSYMMRILYCLSIVFGIAAVARVHQTSKTRALITYGLSRGLMLGVAEVFFRFWRFLH